MYKLIIMLCLLFTGVTYASRSCACSDNDRYMSHDMSIDEIKADIQSCYDAWVAYEKKHNKTLEDSGLTNDVWNVIDALEKYEGFSNYLNDPSGVKVMYQVIESQIDTIHEFLAQSKQILNEPPEVSNFLKELPPIPKSMQKMN